MDNLKTWPERIYLQCGDDASEPGDTPDYADAHDVTWEVEKINACDVEYVRADLAPTDIIASELDKVTVDKCAYLAKKGMRFVGAVMMDTNGRRATIDMGRVTWSDAPDQLHQSGIRDLRNVMWIDPQCADKGACQSLVFKPAIPILADPLQELADQAQALGMGYGNAITVGGLPEWSKTDHQLSVADYEMLIPAIDKYVNDIFACRQTKDGMRYQWIRSKGGKHWTILETGLPATNELYDAAVDDAMLFKCGKP